MIAWLRKTLGLDAPRPGRVTPAEAQALLKNGAVLIDVRSAMERQAIRIPGSRALPLEQLPERWTTLPAGTDVICQCASGNRSAQAARFLAARGVRAHNLSGGIHAWNAAGLPVKRG